MPLLSYDPRGPLGPQLSHGWGRGPLAATTTSNPHLPQLLAQVQATMPPHSNALTVSPGTWFRVQLRNPTVELVEGWTNVRAQVELASSPHWFLPSRPLNG